MWRRRGRDRHRDGRRELERQPERRHECRQWGTIAARDIDGWPSTAPADTPAFPGHVDNLMVGRRNVRAMPDGAPGGMSVSASDAG
jgi:hypothetical protein